MNPTRAAAPPPPAPLAGTVPDASTAQLRRGVGTRSLGDALAHWRAWAALCVGAAGVVWGAAHLVAAGAPWLDVLFWAGVLLGVLGVGAGWIWHKGPAADLWQLRAIREYNAAVLAAYTAGHSELRAVNAEWSVAHNVPPAPPAPPADPERNYVGQAVRDAADAKAQAADVGARFLALAARAEGALGRMEAFRVAPAPPPDQPTQHLPDRPPLPDPPRTGYVGSDAELLMSVLFSNKPAGAAHFAKLAKPWPRKRYEAARDSLVRAGVLILPPGQGPRLAPDWAAQQARTPRDGWHDLVETYLARDGQGEG